MKVVAVTDPETALAFRLSGIETYSVSGSEKPGPVLSKLAEDKDVGLVLVTERLAQRAGDEFEKILQEKTLPLFLEIPDIKGPARERKSSMEKMAAILRR